MKKILCLLIITANLIISYGQDKFCDPALLDSVNNSSLKDATWLKDFPVHLEKAKETGIIPEAKYTMVLSKKSVYRFVIGSSSKFKGKMKLSFEDASNNLLFSKILDNDDKLYTIDSEIKVTCPYHITISSINGEEGCAAFAIFFLKEISKEEDISWFKTPTFQGGDMFTFIDYIDKNLKYPKGVKLDKDILIINVDFEINLDGKVTSAKAKNCENYKPFADEAERVVMSSPKWEQIEGYKVPNQKMVVPVVFRQVENK
jgi:hypothetical protein